MNKMKILGMGHEGLFTYFIVKKNRYFFHLLSILLYQTFGICDVDKYDYNDKQGRWKTKKKRIKDFTDKHESYFRISQNGRVDVFYGKSKIFITVLASKKRKKKFLGVLNEISEWEKIKEATQPPPL